MSKNTSPRRWFQLHLSTGIALMFVAGGLMWLNDVPTLLQPPADAHLLVSIDERVVCSKQPFPKVGWPWNVNVQSYSMRTANDGVPAFYIYDFTVRKLNLAKNVGVALLLLSGCALALEYRIKAQLKPVPQ